MNGNKPETIQELTIYLQGMEKRVLDKIIHIEDMYITRFNNIQKELSEHKAFHWKTASFIIGINSLIVSIIFIILRVIE